MRLFCNMNRIVKIPSVGRDELIGSTFNYLFSVIYQTENIGDERVVWNFNNVSFFHPFFLAPLALYKSRSEKKITCVNVPHAVKRYFDVVCFDDFLYIDDKTDFNEALNSYTNKSYTPICRFDLCKTNVDALQTVLQNIIEKQSSASRKIKTPLSYFLGELICNINQHSCGQYGYVFSQCLSKKERCIDLCIADDGITVYGSYVRAKKYLKQIGDNEAEALRLANEGYSTKDLPDCENRGFGISTSKSMLVDGLGGSFFMFSGGAFHGHDRHNGSVYIKLPDAIHWDGTIILMRIPINVPEGFDYMKYVK